MAHSTRSGLRGRLSALALVVGLFKSFNQEGATVGAKSPALESSVSDLLVKRDHILLLELTGPIFMNADDQKGIFTTDTNAVAVRKALDDAVDDDRVKGVLLRINSPGGTVGMSFLASRTDRVGIDYRFEGIEPGAELLLTVGPEAPALRLPVLGPGERFVIDDIGVPCRAVG